MKKLKRKTTYFKRAYFHKNVKFAMFTYYGSFKFNGSRRQSKKMAQTIRHQYNIDSEQYSYENMGYVA